MTFATGDAVRHLPSGETWECAFVRDGKLYNNGWPLSATPVEQFEIECVATPELRREVLLGMAKIQDRSDPRRDYAIRQLEIEGAR